MSSNRLIALTAALFLLSVQSFGALAFVQKRSGLGGKSRAFLSNVTTGNLIVIGVVLDSRTDTSSAVTDTKLNTYVLAVRQVGDPTSSATLEIWYAKSITGGADTVTVTTTAAAGSTNLLMCEYSGASTTAPLDQTASLATAVNSTTTATSGTATTTNPNEIIFGLGQSSNGQLTSGSGFNQRDLGVQNTWYLSEDQIVSATGTYAATAVVTATWRSTMAMATFKAPGGNASNQTLLGVGP